MYSQSEKAMPVFSLVQKSDLHCKTFMIIKCIWVASFLFVEKKKRISFRRRLCAPPCGHSKEGQTSLIAPLIVCEVTAVQETHCRVLQGLKWEFWQFSECRKQLLNQLCHWHCTDFAGSLGFTKHFHFLLQFCKKILFKISLQRHGRTFA